VRQAQSHLGEPRQTLRQLEHGQEQPQVLTGSHAQPDAGPEGPLRGPGFCYFSSILICIFLFRLTVADFEKVCDCWFTRSHVFSEHLAGSEHLGCLAAGIYSDQWFFSSLLFWKQECSFIFASFWREDVSCGQVLIFKLEYKDGVRSMLGNWTFSTEIFWLPDLLSLE